MSVYRPVYRQWGGVLRMVLSACAAACVSASCATAGSGYDLANLAKDAWRVHDQAALSRLRDEALRRHDPLAMWVDYWNLSAHLDTAGVDEVEQFFARWPGTYVEDRLRNDWLLELGRRQDWAHLLAAYPAFRMDDDRQVRCYVALARYLGTHAVTDDALSTWLDEKDSSPGCDQLGATLAHDGKLPDWALWAKLRTAVLMGRQDLALQVAGLVGSSTQDAVSAIMDNPLHYITRKANARTPIQAQLSALALARLAQFKDPERAAAQLAEPWQSALPPQTVAWIWAAIGRTAAMSQMPEAPGYFAHADQWLSKAASSAQARLRTDAAADAGGREPWWDDLRLWQARSAVRAAASPATAQLPPAQRQARWQAVLDSIKTLREQGKTDAQNEPAWVYWRARAMIALGDASLSRTAAPGDPAGDSNAAAGAGAPAAVPKAVFASASAPVSASTPAASAAGASAAMASPVAPPRVPTAMTARERLISIVNAYDFYGQLAAQQLGGTLSLPPPPPAPSAEELAAAQHIPGLDRAMRLIDVDLRSEGVREWNYTLSFGRPGGLGDRELLAAAQWACEKGVWDRCINTSDRTRDVVDVAQRYPTPFKHEIVRAAREVGLDPALMYGLIRQESRFITSARSGVGAAGLMQIMPGTARWTARKLGLRVSPADLHDAGSNLRLGAGYLRLLLDNFGGSQALATAAYNAGPNRPRRWREGAPTETAAWIENIPFSETRDYVKKVLANASVYSVILQRGEDRDSPPVVSLAPRLGAGVAPLAKGQSEGEADLP